MSDSETDIQHCVERLCEQGCDRVYEFMDALQEGLDIPEIGPLSPAGRRSVLDELRSIMAVYERNGR